MGSSRVVGSEQSGMGVKHHWMEGDPGNLHPGHRLEAPCSSVVRRLPAQGLHLQDVSPQPDLERNVT